MIRGMGRFLAPFCAGPQETGTPPDFSVVIPTYESAEPIAEAGASALNQTYPSREVIVVDYGSRDNPAEPLQPCLDRTLFMPPEYAGVSCALISRVHRATR